MSRARFAGHQPAAARPQFWLLNGLACGCTSKTPCVASLYQSSSAYRVSLDDSLLFASARCTGVMQTQRPILKQHCGLLAGIPRIVSKIAGVAQYTLWHSLASGLERASYPR